MASEQSPRNDRLGFRQRGLLIAVVTAAVLLTFWAYLPSRAVPFDILDFSEFLPLLQRHSKFGDRLYSLVEYYAGQGRANVAAYFFLVTKWELWGDWTPAWQWTRFVQMWLIIVLCYLLLRRIGTTVLGALAGSSIFMFSPSAAEGWSRLTMGEPLGTVCLLAMALLCSDSNGSALSRHKVAACIAAFLVLLLTKEMLVTAAVLPVALVAARRDVGTPLRLNRDLRVIVIALTIAAILALAPLIAIAIRADSAAYSSAFGVSIRSVTDAFAVWLLLLFPFDPFSTIHRFAQALITTAYVLVLFWGWRAHLKSSAHGREWEWILLGSLLLYPLMAGLIYLPWPMYNRFYGIPFLLGTAILSGVAVSALERQSQALRAALAFAVAAWTLASAFAAANGARRSMAARELYYAVVLDLSKETSIDSFFVASPTVPSLAWTGLGATISRYGAALNHSMPPARDLGCDDLPSLLGAQPTRTVVLVFSDLCRVSRPPDTMRASGFRRWSLLPFGVAADSIWINYWKVISVGDPRTSAASVMLQ